VNAYNLQQSVEIRGQKLAGRKIKEKKQLNLSGKKSLSENHPL
jgi:hypothetical protein